MINIERIKQVQKECKGLSIVELKLEASKLCDEFGITPMQSLDIVLNRCKDELVILKKIKVNAVGTVTYTMKNGIKVELSKGWAQ